MSKESTLALDQVLVKLAPIIVEYSYWDGDHLIITDVEKFNKAKKELTELFEPNRETKE